MSAWVILRKAELPLEVVILLVGGTALVIIGLLLFPASAGTLPSYENGLYGLFLVIFAFQMITLGRTPFGDMRGSGPLLAVGIAIAAVGIVTCFIPIATRVPRMLLFLCFGPGGLLLFLQMCLAKNKLQAWLKYGGILRHLIPACSAVYVLSMLMALLLLRHGLLTTPVSAVVTLSYGLAVLYLAAVLSKVYRRYPEAGKGAEGDVSLSADHAMLLLTGVFMLLLGVLLIPVNLGLLPFSASGQLGLLMVLFSIQMLASGSTPIGPFVRSWLMIALGLVFAALGIISCVIPEILVSPLTVLVGMLNILGGVITLLRIFKSRLNKPEGRARHVPPVLAKLFAVQLSLNLLAIMFGVSMLIPNLVHGLVIGVILAANGGVLLYLLYILLLVDSMQRRVVSAA